MSVYYMVSGSECRRMKLAGSGRALMCGFDVVSNRSHHMFTCIDNMRQQV